VEVPQRGNDVVLVAKKRIRKRIDLLEDTDVVDHETEMIRRKKDIDRIVNCKLK
jgi:hypothetical protein